ncbi:MAG: flagellar basal body rod protein FlgC [Deltaproteobacteria bacterium]|jgi:flagellar basal-body rod protein FlgC|nr:flagellar basal body rod protein FlgC [Deltaproteobacteria bacterium]
MSIVKGFDILGSGMSAQRTRLNTVSSNLANAETTRTAEGGPYARRVPVFEAIEEGEAGAGVRVSNIETDPVPGPMVYDPGHPDAGPDGYVKMPNVNVVEEMVDMMTAARSFEANVQAFQTLRDMVQQAMNLGKG